MKTAHQHNDHPQMIVLVNGERRNLRGYDRQGRPEGSDGTSYPWDEVGAFLVWHEKAGRYLSIPL